MFYINFVKIYDHIKNHGVERGLIAVTQHATSHHRTKHSGHSTQSSGETSLTNSMPTGPVLFNRPLAFPTVLLIPCLGYQDIRAHGCTSPSCSFGSYQRFAQYDGCASWPPLNPSTRLAGHASLTDTFQWNHFRVWSSGPLLGWNAARRAHRPKWAKLLHRVTASKYIVPVNISSLFWQFVLQTLQRLFHDCPWQFVLLIPQALWQKWTANQTIPR